MVLPFCLLVSCFAAWGMAGDMTAPLVKVFRSVFSMNNAQSSLVQSAYYGAYFCLAIPAAFINSRLGYKGGVLIGLGLARWVARMDHIAGLDVEALAALVGPTIQRYAFDDLPGLADPA